MDHNSEYLSLKYLVQSLEKQLISVREVAQKDFGVERRRIEEQFERCTHALDVRKYQLLSQLDNIAQQQEANVFETQRKLSDSIARFNEAIKAGSFFFPTNREYAETIWKGAHNLTLPSINLDSLQGKIYVTLSAGLLGVIESYGTALTVACNETLDAPSTENISPKAIYCSVCTKDINDQLLEKGDSQDGQSYTELKVELESIQEIIFDEAGKYTEIEKEDANIRYEKVSQEFQQTPEYKAEVAAALEEKKKVNEPLNKAALEKMVKVYNAVSIREDASVKDRVQNKPVLMLIGMDPKAILYQKPNDFSQYMLQNLTLDELRAIRASLPKFRNDQKIQMDWVESLEQKIDQVSKEPPKKPAAKKARAIKIKTKAGFGGTDFLAELQAKQAKEAADRGEVVEEEKKHRNQCHS